MKKFDKRKVPAVTYNILQQLSILPEKKTTEQVVKEMKKLLKQLTEENVKITLYTTSGNGNPELWNLLTEEIMNALSHGMRFFHCFGPVICTDENGKHASIEAYKEYPNSVELWLSRTRNLYHWKTFLPLKTNQDSFYTYGECYHNPFSKVREIYTISLEERKDPLYASKAIYLAWQIDEFKTFRVIRDKITNPDSIPNVTSYQLKSAYDKARKMGEDINLLTDTDIFKLLNSKHL